MFLAKIGTAGVISAYFFRHLTSGYSLNVSDPIEGQPVQLSYYLCVFGCGLVFWLLVLLWAKLHEVAILAKLANLITPITTLSLCGCLLGPFVKFPLLVRFLVLFQASSNLALLLIWAFLSLKEYMKSSLTCFVVHLLWVRFLYELGIFERESLQEVNRRELRLFEHGTVVEAGGKWGKWKRTGVVKVEADMAVELVEADMAVELVEETKIEAGMGKVEAGGGGESGSGHGSGASGSGEDRGRNGGNDGGGGGGAGGGGADPESVGRVTNTEQTFKSSKITEMSLMLTAQTTAALVGFHLTTPSSSSKAMLVVVLIDLLVAYLCGLTSILLSSNKPEHSEAAKIFADIGFYCTTLGFILTVAMFVTWYLVLITVLLFGVVWLIFFRNGLKTRATKVWDYLKNITQSIKSWIEKLFETGS